MTNVPENVLIFRWCSNFCQYFSDFSKFDSFTNASFFNYFCEGFWLETVTEAISDTLVVVVVTISRYNKYIEYVVIYTLDVYDRVVH